MIVFDASMLTGNGLIDAQHEELFRRVNNLLESPDEERTSQAYEALDFLRTYVLFHFEREEELMRNSGYPEFDEHQVAHGRFRSDVEEAWLEMEYDGYSDALADRLTELFTVRFVEHIKTLDRALAAFVTSDGVQLTE